MVADGGDFTYHVNPSTRPFSDSRAYFAGEAPSRTVTVTSEEERTGTTLPPAAGTEDVPIEVVAGTDSLVVTLTSAPGNDYDMELLSPDLVVLDSSGNGDTDERVEFSRPNGIQPGQYVARVINFAAVTPWDMVITQGTLPDEDNSEAELAFSPRTVEEWTVTCTIDGEVVSTRDVTVDRGQSRDLGQFCDPDASGAVTRLSGPDRFATAIAVSRDSFPEDDSAAAVVLARGDDPNGFADALAGGPLAVDRDGPLLITNPDQLFDAVAAEIDRVLPDGATVYLLGGTGGAVPRRRGVAGRRRLPDGPALGRGPVRHRGRGGRRAGQPRAHRDRDRRGVPRRPDRQRRCWRQRGCGAADQRRHGTSGHDGLPGRAHPDPGRRRGWSRGAGVPGGHAGRRRRPVRDRGEAGRAAVRPAA